jgi:hypothetical protein
LDLKGGCKAEKVAFLQQNVFYCWYNREVVRMKQSIRVPIPSLFPSEKEVRTFGVLMD